MVLVIISHTPHFLIGSQVVGWSATVREINELSVLFDKVYHLAPLKRKYHKNSKSCSGYDPRVEFVDIPDFGGSGFLRKVKSLVGVFRLLTIVSRYLRRADLFHCRLPASLGLIIVPYLFFFGKKGGWFKFAGNWVAPKMPLSYRVQKTFLIYQRRFKVTINGTWPSQHSHLISFENPCLTKSELTYGAQVAARRDFKWPLTLLFVGRVDELKGFDRLIMALNILDGYSKIARLIVVGEGAVDRYRSMHKTTINVEFVGGCSREEINKFYAASDLLVLPSISEGFPKVVAEAAAFGCVPVVSNVSALYQYIDDSNGHLLSSINSHVIAAELKMLSSDLSRLAMKSKNAASMAELFTYDRYIGRVRNEIINGDK